MPDTDLEIIHDLSTIWDKYLLPHIEDPEVESVLQDMVNRLIPDHVYNELGEPAYFRFGKDVLHQIKSTEKPWKVFPLFVFAPTENPECYKKYIGTHKEKLYERAEANYQNLNYLLDNVKDYKDIRWWAWLHECRNLNGTFLFTLIKKAFPNSKFYVLETDVHCWVQDGNKHNFCLFWPAIGITSLKSALEHKGNKLPVAIYEYPRKMIH